jgi:oligopeptide/dipeptide ABC transporter ATP-binding protein
MAAVTQEAVLSVRQLATSFDTEEGRIRAVDGVNFDLRQGSTLGLVGESGCGKSVTALSIMRLLPRPSGRIDAGEVLFDGMDLVTLPAQRMQRIRGSRISMIFQEPMTALNPVHRIGHQLAEVYRLHFENLPAGEIHRRCVQMLQRAGIPEPEQRLQEYPYQISGGMRQRVMIAMALAAEPDILIADEPTTALDVTIQAQILALISDLQQSTGMSLVFITHDLGVIAEICDQVVVMYAGRVVESAPVGDLFADPCHPYTRGLLASMPRLDLPAKARLNTIRGMVPSLGQLPAGCRFHNRCDRALPICENQPPQTAAVAEKHLVSCHLYPQDKGQAKGGDGP